MAMINEDRVFEKLKIRIPLLGRIKIEGNQGFEFQRYVIWPVTSIDRFKLNTMNCIIDQELDFVSVSLPIGASEDELVDAFVKQFELMFNTSSSTSFARLIEDFRRCEIKEEVTTFEKFFTDNYYNAQSTWKTFDSHTICFVTNKETYEKLKNAIPNDESVDDAFTWMIVSDDESYNDVVYAFNVYDVILRSINTPNPIFISNKLDSMEVKLNSYMSIDSIDEQISIYKYTLGD